MDDHDIALAESAADFTEAAALDAQLDRSEQRAPASDAERRVAASVAEDRAGRHAQRVFDGAQYEAGVDPIGIAQSRPFGARAGQFDDDPDALLLDAERGDLGEAAWLDANDLAGQGLGIAPPEQFHGHPRAQPHRVGGQHVHFHFQPLRVANLEQGISRLHWTGAFEMCAQHHADRPARSAGAPLPVLRAGYR